MRQPVTLPCPIFWLMASMTCMRLSDLFCFEMLLAGKPKQPKLQEGVVRLGGKNEAWYYRQDYLDIWQSSGGLEWLRQQHSRTKL